MFLLFLIYKVILFQFPYIMMRVQKEQPRHRLLASIVLDSRYPVKNFTDVKPHGTFVILDKNKVLVELNLTLRRVSTYASIVV